MVDMLIRCDRCWGRDEMSSDGFIVMTDTEWKNHLRFVKRHKQDTEFEVYVSINDYVTYDGYDDYKKAFRAKKLRSGEGDVLRALFPEKFTFWSPKAGEHVTLDVAGCGVIPLYCPEEWDFEEEKSEEVMEDEETEFDV